MKGIAYLLSLDILVECLLTSLLVKCFELVKSLDKGYSLNTGILTKKEKIEHKKVISAYLLVRHVHADLRLTALHGISEVINEMSPFALRSTTIIVRFAL